MATVTNITTIANATSSAHSYSYFTLSNQGGPVRVRLAKTLTKTGQSDEVVEAIGVHASNLTTAGTLALNSLNAQRRHRYAGSPGLPSGATVKAEMDGTTPTVDTNY